MAKTQNLSLNPTKISGTCGRLMCCLKYEQDAYESLIKSSPKSDSLVNTCDGIGTVTDSNLLKQTVKVRLEQDPSTIKCYNNCDICVLRNGKAKKNDPPIPTDLPPLPKPEAKLPEPETITLFDETTLSNYTAEDSKKEPTEPRRSPRGDKSQENRRKPKTKQDNKKPQNASRPQDNKKPRKKPEQPASKDHQKEQKEGKSKPYRRRYYRGGKKPSGGNGTSGGPSGQA